MRRGPILLVEDNIDDVNLTIRALEKGGIANEIVVAGDGVEAMEFLSSTGGFTGRDTSVLPQLILLDLNMPRMNGLEFLLRLRHDDKTRNLPVVILTTSNEDRDKIDSYRLGASSYVRKPVDARQFMEAVRELGLYWLLLNEPEREAGSAKR